MAWPTKTDFVDGDVLTAAQVNNIGTNLNLFNPTLATNGQVPIANGSGSVAFGTLSVDSWTSITTGNLSGGTTSLTGIPATYKKLHLYLTGVSLSGLSNVILRVNNQTGSIYFMTMTGTFSSAGTQTSRSEALGVNAPMNFQFLDPATTDNFYYIQFPNYTSTTTDRVFPFVARTRSSGSSPTGHTIQYGVVGTVGYSAAIDRIDIFGGGGSVTFDAGTYALFGEK